MFMSRYVLVCGFFMPIACQVYLNKWAVQIGGGEDEARNVAERHGFTLQDKIGELDDYYLLEHHHVSKRSTSAAEHHHSRLHSDDKVLWAEQQVVKKRVKRDLLPGLPASSIKFQDPSWEKMWYLHGGARGGYDMNVIPAWKRGYTGKGVVITILDDGIEHNHTDLLMNYDPAASWDINNNDPDPMPKYDDANTNRHGTRCAGEVAAMANNTRCVIGVAYNAKIGGVRMLDGDVSDFVEAKSLSLNPQHIDIYSASWGPDDNGKVVDGPGKLAKEAFIQGVLKGRRGRGSIFVWASGNGGSQHDSCDCDGYTNSIFTLSISSASEKGTKPWYLEECSSTLATTYSSGQNYGEKKIVTTDLHDECTDAHTGTSASAPLAAGLIALALEANKNLTWRDMQYLVVLTARPEPLVDGDWSLNGVNRKVSHKYGYGLMDADALVGLAEKWTNVPEQRICTTQLMELDRTMTGNGLMVKVDTNGCEGTPNHVRYLEHVQAKVSIEYSSRGDLQIYLVSPNNTRTTLLQKRKSDYQPGTFNSWPFMSVHFWGENPIGTWRLEVQNSGSVVNKGLFGSWQLIMYGTSEQPVSLHPPSRNIPTTATPSLSTPSSETSTKGKEDDQDKTKSDKSKENESWLPKFDPDNDHEHEEIEEYICHEECESTAGCLGPDPGDCIICKQIRMSLQGDCVRQCPAGHFADITVGLCQSCEAPCLTCDGPAGGLCQSCVKGFYYLKEERMCVEGCPTGYYSDDASQTCEPCALECQTCFKSSSNCSACASEYEMVHGECVSLCSDSQFRNLDGQCVDCHPTCLTCTTASDSSCLSCQINLLYQNGSCVDTCRLGFYQFNSRESSICKRCPISCSSCVGDGEDQCTSCAAGLKLQNGRCVSSCAPGLYEDEEGKCLPCNELCDTCHGPTQLECLSCSPDLYLWNGECVRDCPTGSYLDPAHGQCHECHFTCDDCEGPEQNQCITCDKGLYYFQSSCLTHCPPKTYLSEMECRPCHESCLTCMGPDAMHCLVCEKDRLMLDNQCLESCPQSYYSLDNACHRCGPHCLGCTAAADHPCTSCDIGFIIVGGQCVPDDTQPQSNCPSSTFWDHASKGCEGCDSSCDTCQGPGPNNCLSCQPPRLYYSGQHRCVLCCSVSLEQGCCNCHPNTGVCMENRNINEEPNSLAMGRGQLSNKLSPDSPTSSSSSLYSSSFSSSIHKVALTSTLSSSTLVVAAVSLCIISVIAFVIVFLALQARSSDRLCWAPRYQPVPTFYRNGTDKVNVLNKDEDLVDEDESYTA